MIDRAPRPRRRRRWSPLADIGAGAVVVLALAVGALGVSQLLDHRSDPARGFQVTASSGGTNDEFTLAELDHPVDPDLARDYGDQDAIAPALADDEEWWASAEFRAGQGTLFDPLQAWRPHNLYRHLDLTSRYVNVVDGARRTWQPPPCDCTPVRVWVYGGSATFGLNQRDDHTVASELAKVAHREGIALAISNRGQMGHHQWLEAERFAWDLAQEPPPDLVLFYDGANDGWATHELSMMETGDVAVPLEPTLAAMWRDLGRAGRSVPDGPPGSKLLGYPKAEPPTLAVQASRTVDRWDRARQASEAAAAAHGVLARYVWQPMRFNRGYIAGEPHESGGFENRSRFVDQEMRSILPEDVIDAGDAFEGDDDPLFTDDVHHSERGTAMVAELLFEHLEDDLRQLQREVGSS